MNLWRFHLRRAAAQTALGIGSIAAITALAYRLRIDFPVVGCLYLLSVVVQSTVASFTSSAIASVVAVLSLDYFFVPPVLSLEVDRPVYGLALGTFLVTALVITRLASRAREETRNANARREDLARLYDLASRLVSVPPEVAVKREYLGNFREVFHFPAMCLVDAGGSAINSDATSTHDLEARTKAAYQSDVDRDDPEHQITIRCLRAGGKAVGAVGFQGLRDPETTAGSMAVLATAMIQRAHSFEAASEAAAAAQVEVLRSALLDAFAHQFKTPLAAILTAAGSLREIGPLVPEQSDMVETIESQSSGLGRLTTRLLRTARLDRDEIRPKRQVTDLCALVPRVGDPYRNPSFDRTLVLRLADPHVEVLADPEMLSLAVVQLVDNAFRYSRPGSTVTVAVETEEPSAVVRVTNEGGSIPVEEQIRIFERFYRGTSGSAASGTGLGLYIARKIVLAHSGTLELDNRLNATHTTFLLKLPLVRGEWQNELTSSQTVHKR